MMQQVPNIPWSLETIKKKDTKKVSVYKDFKENKNFFEKVVDFLRVR